MEYYHNLYFEESLLGKKEDILYKLEHDVIQLNKYVIVLSKNEKNQLEFYNSSLLIQKYYKEQNPLILGIAEGFEGALLLVEQITKEVFEETRGADLRTFLLKKQREFEERKV